MPYQLKKEQFELCGVTLTVLQASNAMDARRSSLIAEAQNSNGQPAEGADVDYLYYMKTLLYPSLVACTEGEVPTLDEFLYEVPTEETTKWTTIAKSLNPKWFRFIVDEEELTEEELEKKEA